MGPGSTVKIFVDLEFPSEGDGDTSVWADFVNANNGRTLRNTFYLGENSSWRSDYATHLPLADGKAVIRKGVYDTGWEMKFGRNLYWGYGYVSRGTRQTYANSGYTEETDANFHASTVTYYTEIYNGSNERLYLEPLQDKLPRGFTFNSMTNLNYNTGTDWDGASSGYAYIGYLSKRRRSDVVYTYTENGGSADSYRLATVDTSIDDNDDHAVTYVNARVSSAVTTKEGIQYIKFTIDNTGCGSYGNRPAIGYDSVAARYYLDPGQALRFGYDAVPGDYEDTDDVAINTIAMPYYNFYGTGFEMDDYHKLKPSNKNGLAPNDGECEQMTAEEVKERYGFDTSAYEGKDAYETEEEGNWLVSEVTVDRTDYIPGIQKTVQGYTGQKTNVSPSTIQGSQGSDSALYGTAYTGGLKTSDIVNWRIRVFAEENAMLKYTLEDTVDEPYLFTGQVFFNAYHQNGNSTVRDTTNSVYLFTIGSRKEGDTTVRINAGNTIGAGSPTITIGSAEDDSDDSWYSFGTGAKAGRVKIEKLADGREKMTIEMNGPGYSIGANSYIDLCMHTQFCKDVIVISEGKFNDSIVKPNLDYRSSAVTKGRALTHSETVDGKKVSVNDGIQSGASVMIVQGYTTTAYKQITEIDTGATARSDGSPNFITLSEKDKPFRYDCYITGPQAVMSKLVFIDALPEEGDHSAFVESDKRYSDFTVKLLNSDFHAYLKPKNGSERELSDDEFTVEGNTKTEFTAADWSGTGTGWVDIKNASPEELKDIRSLRVIINDPNAWQWDNTSLYKMPGETRIHFSFNAHIDDPEAVAGEYAWNSYGYYYTVPQTFNGTEENSIGISLMAQPLSAGVRYPAAPDLVKKLSDDEGNAHEAEKDLTFRFIVYRGDRIAALDNALEMEEADIAAALDGRDYIYVPVTVKAGESEGRVNFWKTDYPIMTYDDGFAEKPDGGVLHWIGGEQFNVIELPLGDYRYTFKEINEKGNNFTFIQNNAEILEINAVNELIDERMEVRGRKIWEDDDDRDGIRPESITVKLLADGEETDTAEPSAEGDWEFRFEDLPRYREDGAAIDYTVEEILPDGYAVEYDLKVLDPAGTAEPAEPESETGTDPAGGETGGGDSEDLGESGTEPEEPADPGEGDPDVYTLDFTITDTHEPELTEVNVSKTWDDDDNRDGVRPETITYVLMSDGEEAETADVTEKDEWKHTFAELPVYRDHGTKIEYNVLEKEVTDYTTTYEGPEENVWEITNRHTPGETSVTIIKIWDDEGNADRIRPEELSVQLMADGEPVGDPVILNRDMKWRYTWTGLPVNNNGEEILYTVTEEAVEGYSAETVQSGNNTIIVNAHTPEPETEEETKKPEPGKPTKGDTPTTGDDFKPGTVALILVISAAFLVFALAMKKRRA